MHSPCAVMEWQAATLFQHDANGRLLATNEPGDPPAPRLFVGRTMEGNLWRFRHDLPETLTRDLDRMLAMEPIVTDPRQPLRCFDQIQDTLAAHVPPAGTYEGPAWWCPEGIAASRAVTATRLTRAMIPSRTFPWLAAEFEERQPCIAVFQDGEIASICFSARFSPVAAEAGVQTMEPYRRRGYAAAVVAAWAGAVRALGRLPLYSTSWENAASQGVAASLGLVLYGADLSFL